MQVALKAYGERGLLAHGLSELEREGLCRTLLRERPVGCVEYVEGYDTVLFVFEQSVAVSDLAKWFDGIELPQTAEAKQNIHELPVIYDGADLKSVAEQTGLSESEVIQIHSAPLYTVRTMGFSPGFSYLDGLDPSLHLPRKDSPRTRIEPGSVAIGGSHAGVYSVASPGGWHLLGRTEVQLFDARAARGAKPDPKKVFLLSPGDRICFQPID
ncbi:MAG: allophanate hydrolase subunit 1 [Verrucomicrobiota bacterium]